VCSSPINIIEIGDKKEEEEEYKVCMHEDIKHTKIDCHTKNNERERQIFRNFNLLLFNLSLSPPPPPLPFTRRSLI
jgi:hypothetical protein